MTYLLLSPPCALELTLYQLKSFSGQTQNPMCVSIKTKDLLHGFSLLHYMLALSWTLF